MSTAFWEHTEELWLPACDVCATGEMISYEELYRHADDFAKQLISSDGAAAFIFILAGNNLESLAAYLGCLRHKHACLLLSHTMDQESLDALCELYQPDSIYRPTTPGDGYRLDDCQRSSRAAMHPDLRVLLSTSGSTGSPKLVRLSGKNLRANAQSIASYLHLSEDERPLTNLPMCYSYGLSVINSHLQAKACLLLTEDSLISKDFWGFAREHYATSLAGVPFTYEMLEMINFRQLDLPSLRYMTQAGGKLSPTLVETYAHWARERHLRFYVMYGQTEATARMSYLPHEETLARPSSIGIAIPGGAFLLKGDDGELTQEPNSAGELIYRGDNVSMGYAHERADFALGDERGGVLHTGDLARSDQDGFFYITGRLNRFVKIAGNRFGLDEIESYLRQQGIEAYCGGRDELLLILVTVSGTHTELKKLIKNKWKLSRQQYQIKHVDQIPRSESGKVLYSALFAPHL